MATKFLDNKIRTFKILLSWRFPRKPAFLDNSPLYPYAQPPPKVQILFLLSSRSLWGVGEEGRKVGREGLWLEGRALHLFWGGGASKGHLGPDLHLGATYHARFFPFAITPCFSYYIHTQIFLN